ncbi:MAG: hypothetical protein KIS96_08400 [Bauldia sp.]|nr:hypothetical protein [Bauldia sp.]
MRLPVRRLLAVLAAVAMATPALPATMDEIRAILTAELGPADLPQPGAYLYIRDILPGRWLIGGWLPVSTLTDNDVAASCANTQLVIEPDLDLSMVLNRPGGQVVIPGRILPWQGRLFALEYDEAAFLAGLYGMANPTETDPMVLEVRRGAHRLLALTPRTPDLLVGYDIQDGAAAVIFIRCPEPAEDEPAG